MKPNYSVYRQMCHCSHARYWKCCLLGRASMQPNHSVYHQMRHCWYALFWKWSLLGRPWCSQTIADTVKCVIAGLLDVGSGASLEVLDVAKLWRIPSNVSLLVSFMLEVLGSGRASMRPNYSVYHQMRRCWRAWCWKSRVLAGMSISQTIAYTVKYVIAGMLDVGIAAFLEGLDAAKL